MTTFFTDSLRYIRKVAAAPALYSALRELHNETAEYVTLNKLGDPHHNKAMKMARDALKKVEGGK